MRKIPKLKFVPNRTLNCFLLTFPFIALCLKHILFLSFLSGDNYYQPNLSEAFQHYGVSFFLSFSIIALLFGITLLFKGRGRYIFALFVCIFTSVLMLIDSVYIRYFNDLPSVQMAMTNLFDNGDLESGDFLILPFVSLDFLYFVDFIVWFAVYFTMRMITRKARKAEALMIAATKPTTEMDGKPKQKSRFRFKKVLISAIIISFAAIQLSLLPMLSGISAVAESILYQNSYLVGTPRKQAAAFTSLGFHLYDIYNSISPEKSNLTLAERAEIEDFFRWNQSDYRINEHFGKYKDKNVIFVQLESFEDFIIGNFAEGQEITPTLNNLLSKSYRFTNIYDQVASGNSSDTDLMAFSSILPSSGVSAFKFFSDNTFNSLPKILKKEDYFTGYYSAFGTSYWGYPPMIDKAFQFDKSDFAFDRSERIYGYASDGTILKQFDEKLTADKIGKEKTYAHVILSSSHMPFGLPKKYTNLHFNGELRYNIMGGYFNSVSYTDKVIGEFLGKAQADGLLDDTIIVFLGDHRGIHKYNPVDVNRLPKNVLGDWHTRDYHSSQVFMIYDPTATEGSGETIDTYGGQVDVMTTLLYLLGVPFDSYKDTTMGRSLVATGRNATYGANERVYGTPTAEELKYLNKMYYLANRILQTNYFAK